MILNVTEETVVKMAKLAVLASEPMFLDYNSQLTEAEIKIKPERAGVYVDYYQDRMVKFYARKTNDGYTFDDSISSDYQSWSRRYASYDELAKAAQA